MKLVRLLALGFATLSLGACGSDKKSGDTTNTCSDDLTYAKVGKPFVEEYCLSCHSERSTEATRVGAPPGIDFDSEADLFEHGTHITEYVEDMTMPPSIRGLPQPSATERARFVAWTKCAGISKSHTAEGGDHDHGDGDHDHDHDK